MEMECSNDWDLQAVVRSCSFSSAAPQARPPRGEEAQGLAGSARAPAAAALLYDLEYLDLEGDLLRKPFLKPLGHELMISFPAASTSGPQPRQNPGRKPAASRTARPKRSKKSQLKKVVCEVPVADGGASTDLWAWRKYGQKPIKGSPYPRGYYKCSSLKGCMARKMVERSPATPGVVVVTYIAEHCHPVPTQLNALAGTTRHKAAPQAADGRPPSSHSPDKAAADNADEAARCEDSAETSSTAAAADGGTETADEEHDFWPVGMELEEFLGPMDDEYDYDHFFDDDGVLGRRLSL